MKKIALLAATLMAMNAWAQHYTQTNLVTGGSTMAPVTDPNLGAPWGLSRSSGSPWWVSDAGTGLSTLYDGTGAIQQLVVSIPGGPTGTVYNGTTGFMVSGKPGKFIFCSLNGQISAWAPGASSTTVMATTPGASYTGLAMASFNGQNYLYATDFQNKRIDVFDSNFQLLRNTRPGITDQWFSGYPGQGNGFGPFNIQNIGGNLYVAFAQQDAFSYSAAGLGSVASFTPQGQMIRLFESGNWLNQPWALALAPGDFGAFSHDLLVGQFGSGQIAAYDISTGKFLGMMVDDNSNPISIGGLWALSFGAGNTNSGPANSLYFTAGSGVFGTLTADSSEQLLGNGN